MHPVFQFYANDTPIASRFRAVVGMETGLEARIVTMDQVERCLFRQSCAWGSSCGSCCDGSRRLSRMPLDEKRWDPADVPLAETKDYFSILGILGFE
jgi:hypothetical protein